ncbi:MAG: type II toxin-antitoxin system Phd/YefM family antitoxin [Gaiellales bacterium]
MNVIPQRELRNNCSDVLRRAEAGENFEITVDGRPVARLTGIATRRQFVPVEDFMRLFATPMHPDWESFKADVNEGIDFDIHDPYERRR